MVDKVGDNLIALHRTWLDGATLDDHLWFLSICASWSQGFRMHGGLPQADRWLWKILQLGYTDARAADRPWDASTRSMRYTAIIGDRLQANIELERARVSTTLVTLY